MWIPGLAGISGNEAADTAAKNVNKSPTLMLKVISKTDLFNAIKKERRNADLADWTTQGYYYYRLNPKRLTPSYPFMRWLAEAPAAVNTPTSYAAIVDTAKATAAGAANANNQKAALSVIQPVNQIPHQSTHQPVNASNTFCSIALLALVACINADVSQLSHTYLPPSASSASRTVTFNAATGYSSGGGSHHSSHRYSAPSPLHSAPAVQVVGSSSRTSGYTVPAAPSRQYLAPATVQHVAPAPVYRAPATSYHTSSVSYSAPAAPAVSYRAPATTYSAPVVQQRAPATQYRAPVVSHSVSSGQYRAPAAVYRAPASVIQSVSSGSYRAPYSYRAPVQTHHAPAVQYHAPAATYSRPVVTSYRAPAATYSAPTISYSAPAISSSSISTGSYRAPAATYSSPAISYSAPATSVSTSSSSLGTQYAANGGYIY
ncbi:cuticle protein LPCP-23-like [Anastrepha obliqua]|uniref:cuticle protein LPCP-23-like n=1 Tax=Anastrepha obliqua TaxID=95512 RepID=UPI0024092B4B|nr:cuticle protein LPCP-23-like [Anastrepha obliqua]